ncbi:MAG: cellulase family glycosylhydrolase [Cyclobacteriaceae bacterium]|nr:cellulase family glycosylhydrolase [Cyclobacteriaceae bacterium]
MKRLTFFWMLSLGCLAAIAQPVWTKEQANAWGIQQPWLVGCNFIPSTAINELEMWQPETFDLPTIDRELGWAEGLGFNTVRVYLHNLLWENDREEFAGRIEKFLETADRHHIRVIFVLFDDCWLPDPRPGKQPDPVPGVHNSGWLRAPGPAIVADPSRWPALEAYTKGILTRFRDDRRILLWDLYNEPGNSGMEEITYPLLEKVFQWAWSVRPSQPLTCATWNGGEKFRRYNDYQLRHSDVVTFHNYSDASNLEDEIKRLQALGKPILCSEYMARTNNSTFEKNLPVLKRYQVGAINWGLVSGKTNTIFPWGSKPGSQEPSVWFHDIFRRDGTPFDPREVDLIRQLTGKKP